MRFCRKSHFRQLGRFKLQRTLMRGFGLAARVSARRRDTIVAVGALSSVQVFIAAAFDVNA